jgi:TrpR-related protein YerC/YecD
MDTSPDKKMDMLLDALSLLNTRGETKKFLRDLLTEQEIIEFANRWQTAQMLMHSIPYSKIKQETGLSSTTIARVSKWLSSGMGGYRLALKRIASQHHTHHSPRNHSPRKE